MQTDIAETISDIVKVLPESKQRRVLKFASDLRDEERSCLTELIQSVERRGQEIPDEVWQELPPDGSINHDHYLYGADKQK